MKEAESELLDYARRHPVAFHYLAGLIMWRQSNGTEESASSISQSIPLSPSGLDNCHSNAKRRASRHRR
jgi:hypothetical protein